jgi:hypothetical protein
MGMLINGKLVQAALGKQACRSYPVGHGLDQLPQRVRRVASVWWLQAVGLGREMGAEVLHNYTEVKAVTAGL